MRVTIVSSMYSDDLPKAVCAELKARGIEAGYTKDAGISLDEQDCVIVVGTALSLPKFSRELSRSPSKSCALVAWVTEPLPPDGVTPTMMMVARWMSPGRWRREWARPLLHAISRPLLKTLLLLQRHEIGDRDARLVRYCIDNLAWLEMAHAAGQLDLVACSTEHKRRYVAQLGLNSVFLPVPRYVALGRDLGLERDIDVLFLGRLKSPRRREALESLQDDLGRRGRAMQIISGQCYDDERTRLINRARVMLHLHQFPSDTPWTRWHLAAANGAAMASEPLVTPEPFTPGEDYLSSPMQDLAARIDALLEDEERRIGMVSACRETIDQTMSLKAVCDSLYAEIKELVDARRSGT